MMILIHEEVTFSQSFGDSDSYAHSLHREGKAMRNALAEDFRRAGHVVTFDSSVAFDAAIVIAPETDHCLRDRVESLRLRTPLLLNCSRHAIQETTSKARLARVWGWGIGVPTPPTYWELGGQRPIDCPLPAVLKLNDGCGSVSTKIVHDVESLQRLPSAFVAQPYIPGRPASVMFLVGHGQAIAMVPTYQTLSDDGTFQYQGGQTPIAPHLAVRAIALAMKAIAYHRKAMLGFVGVDLILGDAADGNADFAIEINPRLTTSYIGLRQLADFNIAQMMLDVCEGKPVDAPRWKTGRIEFFPDGTFRHDPAPLNYFE